MKHTSHFELGPVGLSVFNLKNMTQFYSNIIGFEVLEQTDSKSILGIHGKPYLYLYELDHGEYKDRPYNDVYHVAILLPHEVDLGQQLLHFYRVNYQISGAGDHQFSQALYMNDPEGNGIEIYADRPRDEWGIEVDGTIPPVTKSVDIQRLVDMVKHEHWDGLPKGTKIGHVHLEVGNVKEALKFYQEVFDLDLMTEAYEAVFLSRNGYHHHLAFNAWNDKSLDKLPLNMTGMKYYTIEVDSLEPYKNKLKEYRMEDNILVFEDPNGLEVHIVEK